MIKLENVSYKYKNENTVLKNINLEIQEGECISIIGKNGSGKSTLAKLIAGIEKPTKGAIKIDDINTKDKKEFLNLRKKIGIVFQNPENQILFSKVYDDIAFGLKNLKLKDEETRIKSSLEKVKMQDFINSNLYELSMGQKQRITIAGVLSIFPKYIVFDEPTTMLDMEGKQEVYNIIKELKESGYTVIYITNATDEILISDKIIMLKDGEINCIIPKMDILNNIDKFEKNGLRLPRIIQIMQELGEKDIDKILKMNNLIL